MIETIFLIACFLLPPAFLAASFKISRSKKHGAATSAAGSFFILMFLVSLLFSAGEIYFRYIFDSTDSFTSSRVSEKWFINHWRLNSARFRDDIEYPLAPATGTSRITFVGDSFTAGQGVEVEGRFVNIVRNKLPEVEIHALAKNGLDTIQQIQMLENLVEKGYVLDTVVLVYCMNDIGSLDAGLRDGLRTIVANEEPPLIRDSFLLDLIYNRMSVAGHHEISEYNENLAELYAGETWSQQAKWLRYMKIFVEDHGGQLVVVTFPMIGVMGDDYIFADAHEKLGEFWKNNDIPHLDLFPAFEQYSPRDLVLNRFDAHPNTEAHAIAAGAILKFIDNIENELYE